MINNKHGNWGCSIRIGVVYAPQESRTTNSMYKKIYKGIEEQIEKAGSQKQKVLVVGDFNCKIGDKISGNRADISRSAKYFLKLNERQNLEILNGEKKM